MPGRLEVAILACLPQVGELIPSNGLNFFPVGRALLPDILMAVPDNPLFPRTQMFYRSAGDKPLCIHSLFFGGWVSWRCLSVAAILPRARSYSSSDIFPVRCNSRRSARENRRKRRGRFTDGKSWVREVRKVVVDSCSPAERGVLCNGLCRATEGTKIVNVTARAKGNQG